MAHTYSIIITLLGRYIILVVALMVHIAPRRPLGAHFPDACERVLNLIIYLKISYVINRGVFTVEYRGQRKIPHVMGQLHALQGVGV